MRKNRTCVFAALAILIVLTYPAYAVDGVVLINQASALAGNVTPGDSPGFPVTISVPGSYRLSSNLVIQDPNTSGIEINVDNVTIDLNGFSIQGPIVCSGGPPVTSCSPTGRGAGIQSHSSGLVAMNGTIRGMTAGVSFQGSNNRIERVHAIFNLDGIFSGNGDGIVLSCVTSFNGDFGIFGNGKADGNVADGNGETGIAFAGVVINNTVSNNGVDGISASGVMTGNVAVHNHSAGIQGICPSFISGNQAFLNAGGNITTIGAGCIPANNANNAAP